MSLSLKLSIQEDKELRNYMKDYLKGLVKSISREEVADLVKDEIMTRVSKLSDYDIKKLISTANPSELHDEMRLRLKGVLDSSLEEQIRQMCRDLTRDARAAIPVTIKEEIRKLTVTVK